MTPYDNTSKFRPVTGVPTRVGDSLIERLRANEPRTAYLATCRTAPVIKNEYEAPINPDGPEAADRIQSLIADRAKADAMIEMMKEAMIKDVAEKLALIADNEQLREALTECADDLEVEVRNRWGDDARLAHKLKRDLSPVINARAALSHKG